MKCSDVRAALPLLIYGEPSTEDAALREHFSQCPACRREAEALQGVRRLLDIVPVPRIEVDVAQLQRALAERQMRKLRRWRRVAVTLGAVAALLLLALGLRLEMRLQAGQLLVRWGDPPPEHSVGQAFQPYAAIPESHAVRSDLREDLRVLRELIHALKQDAEDRDQRFDDRLDRLQKHVRALQAQGDSRWNATEQDVAALYLLTRKEGEKP
jgi:hypothetical protein